MNKKIIATAAVLVSVLALGGCGSVDSSSSSKKTTEATSTTAGAEAASADTTATEAETTTAAAETTAPETTEASTEAAPVVIEGSYPCENIGLSVEGLVEKMGKEPTYTMFAEPPRLAVKFGDGASYTTKEASEDKSQLITEVLFNEPEIYTGEIIPGVKFGMSYDEIKQNYPLSVPDVHNLNGTYLASCDITCGGKDMTFYVDFGDDEKCTSASFFQIIVK